MDQLKVTTSSALKIAILFIAGTIISGSAIAQKISKLSARNAISLELGGTGFVYSINYNRIFLTKDSYSLSYGVGINNLPIEKFRPGIIIETSLLTGRSNHHGEFGIGCLFYAYSPRASQIFDNQYKYINPVLSLRIGYRYQKQQGGLFFRCGLTPGLSLTRVQYTNPWSSNLISNTPIIWAGISIGKSF